MNILDQIVYDKKRELALQKKIVSLSVLKKRIKTFAFKPSVFQKTGKLMLIAEIKPKSPSAGVIRKNTNVKALAKQFEKSGASAISVLTEKKHFGGSIKNLSITKKSVRIPVLRKDFIVDPYQVYEAKANGADLVLLISAVLKGKIGEFTKLSLRLGLQPLIEVHDLGELKSVLRQVRPSDQITIGVNNRNLKTFKTDLAVSLKLLKSIPKTFIRVSESGIFNLSDLKKLKKAGFDAVLIGTGLKANPKLFNYFK